MDMKLDEMDEEARDELEIERPVVSGTDLAY